MIIHFAVATIFLVEGIRIHSDLLCFLSLVVILVGWLSFRSTLSRILSQLSSILSRELPDRAGGCDRFSLGELEDLSSLFAARYRSLKLEKESLASPLPNIDCVKGDEFGTVLSNYLEQVAGYLKVVFDSPHFLVLLQDQGKFHYRISNEELLAPLTLSVDLERQFKSESGLLRRWGIAYERTGFFNLTDAAGFVWIGYNSNDYSSALIDDKIDKLVKHIEGEFAAFFKSRRDSNTEIDDSGSDRQIILHASHDIRSPLNNIRAAVQFLVLQEQSEETSELLRTMLRNCQAMEEIVEVMLDYASMSRFQSCKREEDLNLSTLIKETIQSFELQAKLKGLSLKGDILPGVWTRSDRRTVRRAIANLISNAIKYTDSGEVLIRSSEGGGVFSLSVSDTGVGMTRQQLEKLFIPFTRFLRDRDGVGLGLVVTKNLVESLGGNLSVESIYGKGSTFTIEFPHIETRSLSEKTVEPGVAEQNQLLSVGVRQILVVDDDKDAAYSLGRILESYGLKVFCATSVSEAIGIYEMTEVTDVITDLEMPYGGGARLIKLLEAKDQRPRILVLTGREGVSVEQADAVLSKPADVALVLEWLGLTATRVAA